MADNHAPPDDYKCPPVKLHSQALAFGCYWVAIFTLVASASVRAEGCIGLGCLEKAGPLEYSMLTGFGLIFTTAWPFISTSDATKDGPSKHYTQAVKDDAAAYLATDGDIDGPMLESAWRTYLEQHSYLQLSKKEFAHMVLATYG
ncbi:hypothetical protein HK44_013435 [Pseudomonas fluorescens HK44]|uniref:DUF2388 domain-containing protein n=1 Tax=Pseudomonas fluorescens HK44 TaxID=1042209 RepID=A0A010SF59_PSEFL|nr:DUF2388 domain-containing protein [Pseudomonas fluorescens]EXF91805.1 hypothetical protein HK44_013435 [Pseudomonas fluorescens HK44]